MEALAFQAALTPSCHHVIVTKCANKFFGRGKGTQGQACGFGARLTVRCCRRCAAPLHGLLLCLFACHFQHGMGYTLTSSRAMSVSLGMVLSGAGSEQMLGVTYVEFVCEGLFHDVMSE